MVKAQKSFSILMVLALALSLELAATLCLPRPVNAEDAHVTTASEFQAALDTAENNGQDDAIFLAAGLYAGNFQYLPQDGMSLTIRGEPGTTAQDVNLNLMGGAGTVLYLGGYDANGSVTVEGLTIVNGTLSGLKIYCLEGNLDVILRSVVIHDNAEDREGGGIEICAGTEATGLGNGVINVEIYDSVIAYNTAFRRGGGIYADSCRGNSSIDLLIVNSLIYKNQASWSGGGINISACEHGDNNETQAMIINSTIVGNCLDNPDDGWGPGPGVNIVAFEGNGAIASLDLYNTTIYSNTLPSAETQDLCVVQDNPGNATVNAYHSNIGDVFINDWTGMPTYDSLNVISADPAFVDPANDDYHLTAGSPCIDVGTTAVPDPPGLPATDIEGNPRVWGAAPDMGAYEWAGGAPPPPGIGFSPPSFSFSATEGGANPADQALDVWNSGADTLDWSITDDADWLSLSPETGSSTGPADVTEVTVSVDISGMTNGSYNATITISDPAAINSPQMVPVNLTINPVGDQDNPDVATGLDSISGCLVVVYAFDNTTKAWTWYNPSWPPEANTLTTLYMGSGYWINVSEGCDFLTYGANIYGLYEGWNLIGWLGW